MLNVSNFYLFTDSKNSSNVNIRLESLFSQTKASATAHDIKLAVSGAKYYLLCDFLDMTPISTTTTDIEEILILRKAKRISSNIRKDFNTFEGRQRHRDWYINYLISNPYSSEIFARFINHILAQIKNESLVEDNVLSVGYF